MPGTDRGRAGLEEVLGRIASELRRGRLEVVEYAEIEPDPLESTGRRGAELARGGRVEAVAGAGGGSAMDAAKGIAGLAVSGGTPWEYSRCNPHRRSFAGALPIITIPTSAGTGSEMTRGRMQRLFRELRTGGGA